MSKADERDFYIKRGVDVDDDNYILDIVKEDDVAILNQIEKDDEVVKSHRELNKEYIYDGQFAEKEKLDKFINSQKLKWMSTVNTAMDYYNDRVVNPYNKLKI